MPSQFEQVIERLNHLENLVMQVIHMLGPPIVEESLRAGLAAEPMFTEEGWQERVVGDESPRQRLPYKRNDGGEAFVEWDSLNEEVQKAVEFARGSDDPWQLYEGGDGEIRIGISSQVANQLRAWKLGNQTGR